MKLSDQAHALKADAERAKQSIPVTMRMLPSIADALILMQRTSDLLVNICDHIEGRQYEQTD